MRPWPLPRDCLGTVTKQRCELAHAEACNTDGCGHAVWERSCELPRLWASACPFGGGANPRHCGKPVESDERVCSSRLLERSASAGGRRGMLSALAPPTES